MNNLTGLETPDGQIESLLDGIAAAPRGRAPERRLKLISEALTADQTAALQSRVDALEARYRGTRASAETAPQRLAALRAELAGQELDGFVIPRFDEHQGEYVARRAERLAWMTGFTGSAGLAVVLTTAAAVFVDGRYTVQVAAQVDKTLYELRHQIDEPAADWIGDHAGQDGRIGYDPWLHTPAEAERLRVGCAKAGAELVAVEANPVDAVWADQPPAPLTPAIVHDPELAGESSAAKRTALAEGLRADNIKAAVITTPDSIGWLLNIRGGDLPHVPVTLCFAVIHDDATVDLFMDQRKLDDAVRGHLGNAVRLHQPEDLARIIPALGAGGARVQADPNGAAAWFFDRLEDGGAAIVRRPDPCLLPKARKNAVELAGARAAHLTDGLALTRFLAWLSATAPDGKLDEIAAAERLEAFRAEIPELRDLSFRTIAASGPNAALPHYSTTPESNRVLGPDTIFLVDSGGQYPAGTTDVTRTVAIGTPTPEQKRNFTLVLKGHMAISACRFPPGTTGHQIDVLARHALWMNGLDYDHGTGHGVGSYLSVHEGPHNISKRSIPVPLEPGMIVSNEPGFYKVGEYGIRIENLLFVKQAPRLDGQDGDQLCFQPLTCAPIDLNLIEPSLLDAGEIRWLNEYHAWVRETHQPHLTPDEAAWLETATRGINPA